MEIRHSVSPQEAKHFDTSKLREAFLVEDLFKPDEIHLVYSHIDRIIIGGAVPGAKGLALAAGKEIGADSFLERRELGLINIGSAGTVTVDGEKFALDTRDGLYIGRGAKDIEMSSADKSSPAKFYFLSAPAHADYPTKKVSLDDAKQVHLGERKDSNVRTIYQYIHPAVLESCQLVMGMTILEPENIWNTMPTHTHDRRMEVYMYFNLPEDAVVFHYMGEPEETRHVVVRNEQAVINPSWSIHAGAGTTNYTFIWGMVGENQTFTDMDGVPMEQLK
jgi:4-deoxy-L-threo-5-hexosulose-uronate ketol-isomerase